LARLKWRILLKSVRLPLQRAGCPQPPKPTAEPSNRRKSTTANPKPPNGQAADLVAAADKHPGRRGATPLQRSTMPAPSHGWKPPSTTTPGPSSRQRKTTMGPKPPGGQAAAPVVAADMHPERRSEHPPSANPRQSTTTLGSSSGWKPKATDPKPPDGVAAAPVADTGIPPEQTPRVAPSPVRLPDEGRDTRRENMQRAREGGLWHITCPSILGRDT
jgi:hypothetical protein